MEFLKTLYIAATIFGVGVIFVDLIGSVSNASDAESDSEGDADGAGHDGNDGHYGHDGDDGDDGGEGDHDADGGHHHGVDSSHEHGSMVLHNRNKMSWVLKTLGALRTLVYFSFGFGAVGWFALATGRGILSSIVWSVPVGILIAAIAKIVKRIQRSELDSSFKDSELLLERGEVIVSINKGEIGRVRLTVRGVCLERFARAKNNNVTIKKGTMVSVVDVTDDLIYVEETV